MQPVLNRADGTAHALAVSHTLYLIKHSCCLSNIHKIFRIYLLPTKYSMYSHLHHPLKQPSFLFCLNV